MDKITKNPDSAKFTDSPRISNADSQVEKYRIEISKKSESDFINARKLTIQSPVKHEPPSQSSEIDKQISELECLIQRLQEEIIELSNNADKNYILAVEDDATPAKIKEDAPIKNEEESHESKKTVNVIDTAETTSHVYPVILKDVGIKINDQTNKFADLINYSGPSEENMPETFSNIRSNFDVLWDSERLQDSEKTDTQEDLEELNESDTKTAVDNEEQDNKEENAAPDPVKEELSESDRRAAQDEYHLQRIICDLKTEISEKLETLKDVDVGECVKNSEENIDLSLGKN